MSVRIQPNFEAWNEYVSQRETFSCVDIIRGCGENRNIVYRRMGDFLEKYPANVARFRKANNGGGMPKGHRCPRIDFEQWHQVVSEHESVTCNRLAEAVNLNHNTVRAHMAEFLTEYPEHVSRIRVQRYVRRPVAQ